MVTLDNNTPTQSIRSSLLLPVHRTRLDIFPSSAMTIPAPSVPYKLGLVLLKTLEEPGGYVYFVLHIGEACER